MALPSDRPEPQQPAAVALRGICKRFPGVVANDDVDFDLREGEIHALLGENGAGKSTLMSILAGLCQPDSGSIRLDGELVRFRSPRDAIARGVGMVHQQFMLVPTLTVAENIVLGMPEPRFVVSRTRIEREVRALSERHGLHVDPSAFVWQLSVGEQQRVEILKALHRGARVLVLDEPTAVLSPQEVASMFEALRALVDEGRSVVLISHKLDEVLRAADRLTVMRLGRIVASGMPARWTTREELARTMVGRPVLLDLQKRPASPGDAVLRTSHLAVRGDKGLLSVRDLDLEVRAGEIVGIAGVAGSGQRELSEALAGLRPVESGAVELGGREATRWTTRERIDAGLGYVPEDRAIEGAVGALGIDENLALKAYRKPPLARGWQIDRDKMAQIAKERIREFDIAAPGPSTAAGTLSGGNLQKVILARELSAGPRALVAAQPTRGLDIGATETVHKLLLGLRDKGVGVLLISEDLEEILSLSDRIVVMCQGRATGTLGAQDASPEVIGLMMGGAAPGDA